MFVRWNSGRKPKGINLLQKIFSCCFDVVLPLNLVRSSLLIMFETIVTEIQKNKILFYVQNFLRQLIPSQVYQRALRSRLSELEKYDAAYMNDRLHYYNKLSGSITVGQGAVPLREMRKIKGPKAYFFDFYETARYFDQNWLANVLFMDVIHVPEVPTFQKSRPIHSNNANAVLLKMDKKRHFFFVEDDLKFAEKKNMLIGRGSVTQPHRIRFMDMYFTHPMCDLGQVNRVGGNAKWLKPKLSTRAHLKYKFILSLEGNDVATNLKWIMSSNSIAVMPKPKYETWFMEGRLIPDHHYILIRDDYSDLEERLHHYITNTDQAERIISNANAYVKQFEDQKREELLGLMVMGKYFSCTQIQADI